MAGSLCAAAGLASGWLTSEPPTRLTFLAVGQGDCAVFQHRGTTVLVDAGPKTRSLNAGERVVLPRLTALGVESVDLILLSHPDEDHIGGLVAIRRRYPQARIAVSEQFRDHPDLTERLAACKVQPGEVVWLGPTATLKLGDFRLDIRNPNHHPGLSDNEASMFVRLSSRNASAVVTGDASAAVEEQLLPAADWRAQVLKAGHHGSRTSTSRAWLSEVRPRYAVVSCGRDNEYGHPHSQTLANLESVGAHIFRTDRHGEIRFRHDRKRGFLPED